MPETELHLYLKVDHIKGLVTFKWDIEGKAHFFPAKFPYAQVYRYGTVHIGFFTLFPFVQNSLFIIGPQM